MTEGIFAAAILGVFSAVLYCTVNLLPALIGNRLAPVKTPLSRFLPDFGKRKYRIKRIGWLRFPIDFLFAFFSGLAVILFDCGFLGGKMRAVHLAVGVLAFCLTNRFLGKPLSRFIGILLFYITSTIRYLIFLILLPIRRILKAGFRLLFRFLLICRQKYDTIIERVRGKRLLRAQMHRAETAFLPAGFLTERNGKI